MTANQNPSKFTRGDAPYVASSSNMEEDLCCDIIEKKDIWDAGA